MNFEQFCNINNKLFVITGAASGLGRETAILLSSMGAKLILVDYKELGLTVRACTNSVYEIICDITNEVELNQKLIEVIKDSGQRLDGFVHFAGVSMIAPLKSINHDLLLKTLEINTIPAALLAKLCSSRNIVSQKGASFVLISSVYGLVGSSANVAYSMSKAALHGITKSLAIELATKNIRVNSVAPGFVKTDMFESIALNFGEDYESKLEELHPLGLGEPVDVALAVLYLISDMSRWVTGTVLSVDGGFTAR
jgi:NAD(P)-dependent dehydrogenase (short-subunit alcohol dehydrogenase family)